MSIESSMYQLPIDIVEQLRCSLCNCYISSGPVKMQPDGGSICGRCSPSSSELYRRNLLFETAMSKFTFPCRYKSHGCNKYLVFGKSAEHEGVCPYKTFFCPSLPNGICSENLTVFTVYQHFNDEHHELIAKDGRFKLDLEQSCQRNLIVAVDTVVAIIQYNYDKTTNVLNLNVGYFVKDNLQSLLYKIQFISDADPDRILHFKESQCHQYESHTVIEQKDNNFLMSNYMPALYNPSSIYVNISLTTGNSNSANANIPEELLIDMPVKPEISLLSSVILNKTQNHEDGVEAALKELDNVRCYYCRCYCIPPIFEGSDSSYNRRMSCSKCKNKLRSATEKACTQLIFPCRWRGCTFIGNENNIAKHDEQCLLHNQLCPVDFCLEKYFTRKNILGHMFGHGVNMPDSKRMIIKLYCNEDIGSYSSVNKIYFTILEEKLLTFSCVFKGKYTWDLKSKGCEGFTVDIHFEHLHCRIKSKTLSKQNNIDYNVDYIKQKQILPSCFEICQSMEAIIKIHKI